MAKPKLIIIYGPPAAGKLTVAQALAKKTGFKVFHNHLTLDAVDGIIPNKSPRFWPLVDKFRERILFTAAKEKVVGTIFTFCYDRAVDSNFMTRIIKSFEQAGGSVLLVRLQCNPKMLERRVKQASRKQFNKVRKIEKLRASLEKYDFYSDYPKRPSLVIDNTNVSAIKVAAQIVKHYKL